MSQSNKDDFYVGYIPKAPTSIAKFIPFVIGAIGLLIVVLAYSFSTQQKGFSSSTFEFGELSELSGVLSLSPVPNIKVITAEDDSGNIEVKTIPLISYGKFGAKGLVEGFEAKMANPLAESSVTLRGTLIYGDGITFFELTEKEDAFVKSEAKRSNFNRIEKELLREKTVDLVGEIIDPKCYFGVMKPGHGKPHKSCAIRCISGGIPPVVWVNFDNGYSDYYLLLGKDGQAINKEALVYVGDKINIKGVSKQIDDWKVLYVDMEKGIKRITS